MGPVGFTELVVIFFIALIVFGPEKLPDLAKTAAKGLREFRKATDGLKSNWEEHLRETENPVNEIKKTFEEAKADVAEVSEKLLEDPTVEKAEESPAAASEEKKPDAN